LNLFLRTGLLPASLLLLVCGSLSVASTPSRLLEVLDAAGGLPAHIAGLFEEPLAFQQARSGEYFVFDRRAHAVYAVDAGRRAARRLVEIGSEPGRLLGPSAFDLEPNGSFVVADGPRGRERVQIFAPGGARVAGFTLPGRNVPRVMVGGLVLNGVGSLQYTGRSILINQPETGALITEYALSGAATRTIGRLRPTGHEEDRDVHLGLNVGLPLTIPDGGFYFVFQTGTPMFRRYSRTGELEFERHLEGRELDPIVRSLPQIWPRRRVNGTELPLMLPTVRAAAVDPAGNLWIAFATPYLYVYNPDGDKVRVLQLRAAGILAPTSLSFAGSSRLLVTPGCYEFRTGNQP
jgi:hypothetical protein